MYGFASDLCKMQYNDKFGGFIIASKDIKRGSLLLCEKPIIVGPSWNSELCCINCYQEFKTICKFCNRAPLCRNCINHDNSECDFLKTSLLPENFLIEHFDVISVLRCLILRKNHELISNYNEILQMESHCDKRDGTDIWLLHQRKVVKPLQNIGLLEHEDVTDKFIQRLCGIFDVNAFEIRTNVPIERVHVRGLYPKAAQLAHDCVANTFIALDENKTMKIYASVDIKAGEIIYNNYTDSLNGTIPRQEHLLKGKYFQCTCNRCRDPTELGSNMSTIICQDCIDKDNGPVLYDIQHNLWRCINCNQITNNIPELIDEINFDISMTNFDVNRLENIIDKYSHVLHSNHYLLLKVKQILAGILRTMTDGTEQKAARRLLELCTEILMVLRIIHPGISRLTGITLYEQYNQIICLAQIDYESNIIKKKQYLTELLKAESIAKESIGMLIYEPPLTSEGKLAKQAMFELKELRKHIGDLEKY